MINIIIRLTLKFLWPISTPLTLSHPVCWWCVRISPNLINDSSNTLIPDGWNSVTELPAGEYSVQVTDANGCLDTNEVFISNPDTLQLSNITIENACYQSCDGELSVTIEGGQSIIFVF